jgi:2-keto-4-pentenoate hydratase/2-oxohepta-3-ene-1,7-dioic acid hydratase in catechol pathway
MRIVNYWRRGERRLGVVDGADVVDVAEALGRRGASARAREILADTVAFIASGAAGRTLARAAVRASRSSRRGRRPLARVKLAAPMQPTTILCSGANYWEHRDEVPKRILKEPEFFVKVPQGVIGPHDDIRLDRALTKKLDYETELAIVIGKAGRRIAKSKARAHVFGYAVMNDLTLRDRQVNLKLDGSVSYDYGPGKNFDTCAPLGPCIVTADELKNPHRLKLRTLVNREVRQNNTTARMLWRVADLVRFFSLFLTLRPGMIISTGTPGGTAFGTDKKLGGRFYKPIAGKPPLAYLRPGDVLTSEIQSIGQLRNRVVLDNG